MFVQAAAVTNAEHKPKNKQRTVVRHATIRTLQAQLSRELVAARKARGTIRFFARHPRLLHSQDHRVVARKTLVQAWKRLERARKRISRLEHAIHVRRLGKVGRTSPRHAICGVFRRYCRQAVSVAWCESRLRPDAQNGQYLGLFQMGTLARELYGHGPTARAQAVAAHRYFVVSGRDWSPWSCKPSTW